ncbi:creatinine amidohydrolase family protein%2C mycofactocin system [uncultured Eubacterium sp.]|nr:creatinine amidohydrolase family protein%2C mycofactocin system [uncultured Eubacterium sp.]
MIVDLMAESWEDISQMNAEKLVVFLGIAPIEEHGRHLPIGVDVYETNHWIHKAAERLDSALPDYCFAILPTIPLGFADMVQFPGNIHVSRRLIFDVAYETTSAIARWDVHNIIIISAHADPPFTPLPWNRPAKKPTKNMAISVLRRWVLFLT